MIKLKRVYEGRSPADGERILVDRLWPRGLSKRAADLDEWIKDVAPSHELRKWFGHDPARWPEFRRRYRAELKEQRDVLAAIAEKARRRTVTLVFAARDTEHNDAVVLKDVIERLARRAPGRGRRAAWLAARRPEVRFSAWFSSPGGAAAPPGRGRHPARRGLR